MYRSAESHKRKGGKDADMERKDIEGKGCEQRGKPLSRRGMLLGLKILLILNPYIPPGGGKKKLSSCSEKVETFYMKGTFLKTSTGWLTGSLFVRIGVLLQRARAGGNVDESVRQEAHPKSSPGGGGGSVDAKNVAIQEKKKTLRRRHL